MSADSKVSPELAEYIALQISAMADREKHAEDRRSLHRNANRTTVLLIGFSIALFWPIVAMHLFHSTYAATYASALGYLGDIGFTVYALCRRY